MNPSMIRTAKLPAGLGRASHQRGFSLMELLVVMFIIALGTGYAMFKMSRDEPQQLRNSAREFANLTALVEEEAVLSRVPWGMQLYRERDEDGNESIVYRILRFSGEEGWEPATPTDSVAGGRFAPNVIAILEIDGTEQLIEPLPEKEEEIEPTIWLAPGGEVTPFVLQLRFKDAEDGPVVSSDALGRIAFAQTNEDELLK
jgi:general secretion pathway protein H